MTPPPNERKYDGWMTRLLTHRPVEGLATNADLEKELWSLLEYYTIEDVTRTLFAKHQITDKKLLSKLIHDFQSYIEQARNFYKYGRDSDYRSAPLLYYYAFMNLAKATIILADPSLHSRAFHHGLSRVTKTGKLSSLSIKSQQTAQSDIAYVFRELYKARTGVYFPTDSYVKIIDLLGYISDIASEYQKTTGYEYKTSHAKYIVKLDKKRRKSWTMIAIFHPNEILKHKKHTNKLLRNFPEVTISSTTRQSVLEMSGGQAQHYRYFESSKEYNLGSPPFDTIDTITADLDLKSALGDMFQSAIYDQKVGFELVEPIDIYKNTTKRKSGRACMDELTAIYMVMYHLSEIVRYEPAVIDELLSNNTKESWMLRSFIHSAPYTLLLRILSDISGTNYFLTRR